MTTVLEKPYAMKRIKRIDDDDHGAPTHAINYHQLEGFCVDILEEVAAVVGFNYRLKVVDDGSYGKYVNATGRWNGMIGELLDEVADMAAAPLTITYAREEVVDFSKPFLHLGISILHVQPTAAPPSLFSFMDPLAGTVWGAMFVMSVAVTAVLLIVGRLSPKEFNYNDSDNEGENHPYSCGGSLWYVVGGFLGLGSEIAPVAMSTRLVTISWWFFSLIIISSYTANLAAFLTIEHHISPFENVDEMARQVDVEYGTLKGGSTENFFREGQIDTYQTMWSFMAGKDVFAKSNDEGIERVRVGKGKYAYLMESVSLQYVLKDPKQNQNCMLRQVGGLIDSKGYGFAFRRGSPYRDLVSMAILQLQETDRLQLIFDKWWKSGEHVCGVDQTGQGAKVMEVNNVKGIFVVLGFGFALAIVVLPLEVFCKVKKRPGVEKYGYNKSLGSYCWITLKSWGSSKRPYMGRRKTFEQEMTTMQTSETTTTICNGRRRKMALEEIANQRISEEICDDSLEEEQEEDFESEATSSAIYSRPLKSRPVPTPPPVIKKTQFRIEEQNSQDQLFHI